MIEWRDHLASADTLEAAYLDIVRRALRSPHIFIGQLVPAILRNMLNDCDDVFVLRAATRPMLCRTAARSPSRCGTSSRPPARSRGSSRSWSSTTGKHDRGGPLAGIHPLLHGKGRWQRHRPRARPGSALRRRARRRDRYRERGACTLVRIFLPRVGDAVVQSGIVGMEIAYAPTPTAEYSTSSTLRRSRRRRSRREHPETGSAIEFMRRY